MPVLKKLFGRKTGLGLEFLAIFGGLPLLVLTFKDRGLTLLLLWVGALAAYFVMRRKGLMRWNGQAKEGLKMVLIRFAAAAPLIGVLTWYFIPESFLSFPRERPQMWLTVMLLYPLLSVWPQETIYRAFLHARYEPLFGQRRGYVIASALAFGFMHIILFNWVAVLMTVIGGYMFASDYARYRSLTLACIEHALYGCLIFTVGLGRYFYTGAAWN